jgi:hypothetical protein
MSIFKEAPGGVHLHRLNSALLAHNGVASMCHARMRLPQNSMKFTSIGMGDVHMRMSTCVHVYIQYLTSCITSVQLQDPHVAANQTEERTQLSDLEQHHSEAQNMSLLHAICMRLGGYGHLAKTHMCIG